MPEGMQTINDYTPGTPGMSAVAEPPTPRAAKRRGKAPSSPAADDALADEPEVVVGAVVGLPVQFCTRDGEVVPGTLQRQSRSNPALWDVRISLNGASVQPTRSGVAFSPDRKIGHWSFLPGFEPK